MFFANGQNFTVILHVFGCDYVMHEPIGLIPRPGDKITYFGATYEVLEVNYRFPVRPIHKKMQVYLTCTKYTKMGKV